MTYRAPCAVLAFRYECPECGGGGEVWINVSPRDPASGDPVKCWLCGGSGEVTLSDIEDADQVNAERCEDYTPPERTLRPVAHAPEPAPPPIDDPWATPKDAA